MEKVRINLYELLLCLSKAQDLVNKKLANHQQQVAYLSLCLAEELGMSVNTQKRVFFAALIHDIGALSIGERLNIVEEDDMGDINEHALKGAAIIGDFRYLRTEAAIIKFHHTPWDYGKGKECHGEPVPYESHIIHLADRICARIDPTRNILTQAPQILERIAKNQGSLYEEKAVEAMLLLSKKEYIWLDLIAEKPIENVSDIGKYDALILDVDEIIELTRIFSHIIDFRSSFTARHSVGVAVTAEKLAQLAHFSEIERKMMLIAGYLHDIGKLAIDSNLLEKPSKLDIDEFNQMRSHTYYTYQLLDMIPEFSTIKIWAAYHHEKLNGKGYPFHISGPDLTLGSRIMAVADIFTAISENRPYRRGMNNDNVMRVLNDMVANNSIDGNVVQMLIDNFDEINAIRADAQRQASIDYDKFISS